MMKNGKAKETPSKRISEAMAIECAELMHKNVTLKKQREAVFQDGFAFVESILSGVQVNEAAFRARKALLDTLNADIMVHSSQIAAIRKEGREAVREEAKACMSKELETKARLTSERRVAIRERLIPLEATWLVEAESLSDGAISFGPKERRLLQAAIDQKRSEVDTEKTIAGRLRGVERRLDMLVGESYPMFDRLVEKLFAGAGPGGGEPMLL